jgi:hypothetical protein
MTILIVSGPAYGQGKDYAHSNALGDMKCTRNVPISIQARLNSAFKSFFIQRPEAMNSGAMKRWQSDNPDQCPGLVSGRFEDGSARSYAVLLVPTDRAVHGYRLIVFRPIDDSKVFDERILEQSDDGDRRDLFAKPFRSSASSTKHHGSSSALQASRNTKFACYWTKAGYKHSPIDE